MRSGVIHGRSLLPGELWQKSAAREPSLRCVFVNDPGAQSLPQSSTPPEELLRDLLPPTPEPAASSRWTGRVQGPIRAFRSSRRCAETSKRVKPLNHCSRRGRTLLGRAVQPSHTLVLAGSVVLLCSWTLLVVILGWPRDWAMVTFLLAILVAPAMPVACYRQTREHGFHWRLIAASLLSLLALALLGLSFYWVIHHDRAIGPARRSPIPLQYKARSLHTNHHSPVH